MQFSKLAAGAAANVDGGEATGGTAGEIPLDAAAFTPAEEEASPPPPPAETPPAETPASTPEAA